jgi:hypothetical protein
MEHTMLPSDTFAVLELARQREAELARRTHRGHVELASPGRRRRRRRRWR